MKHTLYSLIFVFTAWMLISSCSSTRDLRIPVSVPPAVQLPDHIETVGLINRSLAGEGKKGINTLEGILTGEGLYEDKNGSSACIAGAASQLNIDNLVHAVILDSMQLTGTGTGMMPLPLSWDVVGKICREKNLDGLLVLEVFDTDQGNSATTNAIGQIVNIAQTGQVNPVQPATNSRVRVKMAWRFYDAVDQILIDEVQMNDYFGVNNSNGSGIYDLGEFAKRDAISQSGYIGGRAYASRMFPGWTNMWREYYIRPGNEMKTADRTVQVNNWKRAEEIWLPLTDSPKRKIAGRACYNMAIACELKSEINQAIEWAQKAFTEHKEKRSRSYVRILRNRL
ncbi:MAG: hypothetical protein H6581_04630 [Bacteroidia bacterium]|nr:hypothetical protein [Bacteroidia bacterium]